MEQRSCHRSEYQLNQSKSLTYKRNKERKKEKRRGKERKKKSRNKEKETAITVRPTF